MKKSALIVVIVLMGSPGHAETPWEAYLSNPTPAMAATVQRIAYTQGTEGSSWGYLEADLQILQDQVLGGDSEAFRLAYRLRLLADGGLAEELTILIGRSIRPNPKMFLRELGQLNPSDKDLASLLHMTGEAYVDRPEVRDRELLQRRIALSSVIDPESKTIRDRCLAMLK